MDSSTKKQISLNDLRKENFKIALSVFLSTLFAAILNFIIYMSLTMIFVGLSTKTVGERIYEKSDDGSAKLITEIYYDSTTTARTGSTNATTVQTGTTTQNNTQTAAGGGQTSAAVQTGSSTGAAGDGQTSAAGQTGSPTGETGASTTQTTLAQNQYVESIRTEMPGSVSVALDIVSQLFMLVLFAALIYSKLWERGDRDANSVNFGRMEEDRLRGLRIGLTASVPSIVFYLLLVASKLGLITEKYFFIYRFLNLTFLPVISSISGKGQISSASLSWTALLAILLTVAVLPLVSYAAYLLGYKHISLSEKLIYVNPDKKKKRRR